MKKLNFRYHSENTRIDKNGKEHKVIKCRLFVTTRMPYSYYPRNEYDTPCVLYIRGNEYIITGRDTKNNEYIIEDFKRSSIALRNIQYLKFYKTFPNELNDELIVKIIKMLSDDYIDLDLIDSSEYMDYVIDTNPYKMKAIISFYKKLKDKTLVNEINLDINGHDLPYSRNVKIKLHDNGLFVDATFKLNETFITCNIDDLYHIVKNSLKILKNKGIYHKNQYDVIKEFIKSETEVIEYNDDYIIYIFRDNINTEMFNKTFFIKPLETNALIEIQNYLNKIINFKQPYYKGFRLKEVKSKTEIKFKQNDLIIDIETNRNNSFMEIEIYSINDRNNKKYYGTFIHNKKDMFDNIVNNLKLIYDINNRWNIVEEYLYEDLMNEFYLDILLNEFPNKNFSDNELNDIYKKYYDRYWFKLRNTF